MCRVMGGDLALLKEIEQNNLTWRSVEGGPAIQQALIEPIEYQHVEKSTSVKECWVRDALASLVGGEPEVETPAGNIDVLSGTEVIEVKYYKQWKHGLGQVLAYHCFHPSLAKRLHLFAHAGEVGTQKYFDLLSWCATRMP
ncbi:FirrV-1-A34 [Ectocarpus siliculosus]|uniref:FirrV-1-A34 n=1 Tax=Ectocarpus siliculosus TaxID=2880 RepID=D7G319_ECTSI|nr:FirrV-1-A34 [Ectocarpus siliculosus]|eukprot:CBJ33462.1 FirrV-1-A34 [Ectocarpus siliculosus]